MKTVYRTFVAILGACALVVNLAAPAVAQVGKGLVDPNVAAERDLLTLPHMTPAIVKAMLDKRPFMTVVDLNAFLLDRKLTAQQATEFYGKAFVHVNLNTGSREEIQVDVHECLAVELRGLL